jgi:LuxR family maltose regulon positive regulatory protein
MANIKNGLPNFPAKIYYLSPQLLKKLKGILTTSVTVLEAPSGYGKTTALRYYLKDMPSKKTSIYWWSAEEVSPEISWTRLCSELTRIDSEAGRKLDAMGFPRLTTAWEIAEIISNISCIVPCVLVLDDFQFIQRELPKTVVSALLSYSGANLNLVIVTQTVRPYLRSFFEQKGVHYIRADDLRLRVIDIHQYFQLCGMPISKSDAEELYRYTEGWIAALYLTMLQMQRGEGFSPGQDIIRLMDEIVWKNTAVEQRNALLYLALFPNVTIEQMHDLLQSELTSENLFDLLEETPFIRYEADTQHYVPHAILREMLIRRLKAADRQTKIRCYRRAGTWYARMGEIEQALSCYFKVEDCESVLSLPLTKLTLARIDGLPFVQLATKLLAECPMEIKCRYPIALLRIAYAFIGADKKEQADALMVEIRDIIGKVQDENERRTLQGEWELVMSFREIPDIVKMESLLKQAVDKIGGKCRTIAPDEPFAFGQPLMIFFMKKPGNMEEELRALTNVVRYLDILTGTYSGADVLLKAECAIYQGRLDEAESLCHQAFYLSDEANQWSIRVGAVNQLAQIAFKRGNNKDLTYYIKALEESVGNDTMSPLVSQMLQADYYSWRGLIQLNAEWINTGKVPFPDAPIWVKTYLRYAHLAVLLQKEEYTRFLGAAEAAFIESKKQGILMMEIYIHLLVAVVYFRTDQKEKAFNYVLEALADAMPDQIYLPFIELKCELGDLIETAFSTLGVEMPKVIVIEGEVVNDNWQLLIRYASENDTLPYGLTKREMEVATLAAKGMSNKEIAVQLFVAESTVKYHLRTVFSKLDIERRGRLPELLKG